jgi:hypothetical protein
VVTTSSSIRVNALALVLLACFLSAVVVICIVPSGIGLGSCALIHGVDMLQGQIIR